MNFYKIGKKNLEIYVESRLLTEPSVQAPVRKHFLKTFSETNMKKKNQKSQMNKERKPYIHVVDI